MEKLAGFLKRKKVELGVRPGGVGVRPGAPKGLRPGNLEAGGWLQGEMRGRPGTDFVDLGSWSQHAQLHRQAVGGGFNRFAHSAGPSQGGLFGCWAVGSLS